MQNAYRNKVYAAIISVQNGVMMAEHKYAYVPLNSMLTIRE